MRIEWSSFFSCTLKAMRWLSGYVGNLKWIYFFARFFNCRSRTQEFLFNISETVSVNTCFVKKTKTLKEILLIHGCRCAAFDDAMRICADARMSSHLTQSLLIATRLRV